MPSGAVSKAAIPSSPRRDKAPLRGPCPEHSVNNLSVALTVLPKDSGVFVPRDLHVDGVAPSEPRPKAQLAGHVSSRVCSDPQVLITLSDSA